MKKTIYLLILLSFKFSFSQRISGKIKDSIVNEPIAYVNMVLLNHNIGAYSDENGFYKIDIQHHFNDTLKVSALGYEPKLISLKKFKNEKSINLNFNLKTNTIDLDEIVLSNSKTKYSKKIKLGLEREGNIGVSSLIGHEYCVLIKNPSNIEGKLKSVIIDLKRRANADYIADLRIKVYTYDVNLKKPGSNLINKNIIVSPKNGKYSLKVDLTDYNILFTKNGLCIGAEWIDIRNETKKYDKIGPTLRYTYTNEELLSWTNYQNRGWKNGIMEYKNNKKAKPIMGIEILIQK